MSIHFHIYFLFGASIPIVPPKPANRPWLASLITEIFRVSKNISSWLQLKVLFAFFILLFVISAAEGFVCNQILRDIGTITRTSPFLLFQAWILSLAEVTAECFRKDKIRSKGKSKQRRFFF